jgi:catechol 2,3-dioxygenase-like lactoylglutathione lyase family enzyme
MAIRRVVPNLMTDQVEASRDFYVEVLGFDVGMDMGWIVTLVSRDNPTAQISLMRRGGGAAERVPDISVEVKDVDAVHAEAVRRGFDIIHPLTDEEWGVRRFFVVAPSGTVVNVMAHREGIG